MSIADEFISDSHDEEDHLTFREYKGDLIKRGLFDLRKPQIDNDRDWLAKYHSNYSRVPLALKYPTARAFSRAHPDLGGDASPTAPEPGLIEPEPENVPAGAVQEICTIDDACFTHRELVNTSSNASPVDLHEGDSSGVRSEKCIINGENEASFLEAEAVFGYSEPSTVLRCESISTTLQPHHDQELVDSGTESNATGALLLRRSRRKLSERQRHPYQHYNREWAKAAGYQPRSYHLFSSDVDATDSQSDTSSSPHVTSMTSDEEIQDWVAPSDTTSAEQVLTGKLDTPLPADRQRKGIDMDDDSRRVSSSRLVQPKQKRRVRRMFSSEKSGNSPSEHQQGQRQLDRLPEGNRNAASRHVSAEQGSSDLDENLAEGFLRRVSHDPRRRNRRKVLEELGIEFPNAKMRTEKRAKPTTSRSSVATNRRRQPGSIVHFTRDLKASTSKAHRVCRDSEFAFTPILEQHHPTVSMNSHNSTTELAEDQFSHHSIRPLPRQRFVSTTFEGACVYDLFDFGGVWHGPTQSQFGTPIEKASVEDIQRDFQEIENYATASLGDISFTLYAQFYDYLLTTAVALLRQELILTPEVKHAVIECTLQCAVICTRGITSYKHIGLLRLCVALFGIYIGRVSTHTERNCRAHLEKLALRIVVDQKAHIILEPPKDKIFDRTYVGVELLRTMYRLKVTPRDISTETRWQLIFFFAAATRKPDWSMVKSCLHTSDIQRDPLLAIDRCLTLICTFKWPIIPEILFLFHRFFTYFPTLADPEGEAIDFPAFLWESRIPLHHRCAHHAFLELLAITLKTITQNDLLEKIVVTMTPDLTPPLVSTENISWQSLSMFAQGLGTLLILIRFCKPSLRPHVSKLFVSKNSHPAVHIKAINSWAIAIRLYARTNSRDELEKCSSWVKLLIDSKVNDFKAQENPLLQEVFATYLTELLALDDFEQYLSRSVFGLVGMHLSETLRLLIWRCWDKLCEKRTAEAVRILQDASVFVLHYYENGQELDHWINYLKVCGYNGTWPNPATHCELLIRLIGEVEIPRGALLSKVLELLARPVWSVDGQRFLDKLHESLGWPKVQYDLDKAEKFLQYHHLITTESSARVFMEHLKYHFEHLPEFASPQQYLKLVSIARNVFSKKWPALARKHNWIHQDKCFSEKTEFIQRVAVKLNKDTKAKLEWYLCALVHESLSNDHGHIFNAVIVESVQSLEKEYQSGLYHFVVNELFTYWVYLSIHDDGLEEVVSYITKTVTTLFHESNTLPFLEMCLWRSKKVISTGRGLEFLSVYFPLIRKYFNHERVMNIDHYSYMEDLRDLLVMFLEGNQSHFNAPVLEPQYVGDMQAVEDHLMSVHVIRTFDEAEDAIKMEAKGIVELLDDMIAS